MTKQPYFFSLAGIDGSGKTTTMSLLRQTQSLDGGAVEFIDKGSLGGESDSYVDSHQRALRDLIWGHPLDSPVHRLGEMHWMHLQAAWFHTLSFSRVLPALSAGRSVVTDGWTHKLLARVSMVPTLDDGRVASLFDGVAEPDCTILLDVDPSAASKRRPSFSEIEGGNLRGGMRASRQSFETHQRALRDKLLEMAERRNWTVLRVEDQSKSEVSEQVANLLAAWGSERLDLAETRTAR